MKGLSLLVVSSLAMFATHSVSSVSFEKSNNNLETKACYAAATQGIEAAKALIGLSNISYNSFKNNVMCNGMKIDAFAGKYHKTEVQNKVVKIVAMNQMNQSVESRLCLDAISMGEDAARRKYNLRSEAISCNGKRISQFLKSFKGAKVLTQAG